MNRLFFVLFLAVIFTSLSAQVQWRGDRTGVYHEEGLLQQWPANGPELLWHFDGLGLGYSSVTIEKDKIFVTGYTDGQGYLYVLNTEGKLQHKIEYGREFDDSYTGARSAVMHDDGKLYVVSGMAELYCYDMQSLKLLWKKNYAKEYAAENTKHGWHGPPLIVGEKLIIAPGGKIHNIVALNKTTGEMIWSSEGAGSMAGYGVPIYISDQQVPQVAVMMSDHIIGLDISNGKMLWSYPHTNRFREHPNTPVYSNGMLFCTSSYGKGSVMLRLTDNGRNVEKVWEKSELDGRTGHMLKIGDYIYGSGDRANWYCIDWQTGKEMYKDNTLTSGAIIANNDRLYCYTQKGEMAMVKATPEKYDLISKFPITIGTGEHWAHPVIFQGIFYVRHGDSLMAYKIK